MKANTPNFNDLLDQIKEEEMSEEYQEYALADSDKPTDDTIGNYVVDKGSELLNANIDLINRVKNRIATAHDMDELAVLANLFKSSNSILSTLTNISIQNKKDKLARETRSDNKNRQLGTPHTVNNTVFVGTREEMMKLTQNENIADVESVSETPYDGRNDND